MITTARLVPPVPADFLNRLRMSNRFVARRLDNDALSLLCDHETHRLGLRTAPAYHAELVASAYGHLRFDLSASPRALHDMVTRGELGSDWTPTAYGHQGCLAENGQARSVTSRLRANTLVLSQRFLEVFGLFVPHSPGSYARKQRGQMLAELVTYQGLGSLYAAQQLNVIAEAKHNPHLLVTRPEYAQPHRLDASAVEAVVLDATALTTPVLRRLFMRRGIPVLFAP